MNTKKELEKVLNPYGIKVMKYSEFDLTNSTNYGTCVMCGWEGDMEEDTCEACEENEAEKEQEELEHDYFSSRGV